MDLTHAETALLGLLAERPMHAYQIELEVRERDMRYWADLGMSSIYKLLKKFEAEGWVEARLEVSEENRARKVYTLTHGGVEVLQMTLREYLSTPEHTKWRMDIAISNLAVLPQDEVIACLKAYHDGLRERIEGYGRLRDYLQSHQCPPYRLALAERPRSICEGELEWLNRFMEELDTKGGDR
ncbi:PadR family transcriptional regulator [bacterium]|nr:PadR family transcriptional regulator [bacterium]